MAGMCGPGGGVRRIGILEGIHAGESADIWECQGIINDICEFIFCVLFLCALSGDLQQDVHDPREKYRAPGVFHDLLRLGRGAVSGFACGYDIRRMDLCERDRTT